MSKLGFFLNIFLLPILLQYYTFKMLHKSDLLDLYIKLLKQVQTHLNTAYTFHKYCILKLCTVTETVASRA